MIVLGLDLGVASIGWALVEIDEKNYCPLQILGLGSRIVNLSTDETKAFGSTSGVTPTAQRTARRTARKMLKRWKQRRTHLQNLLHRLGMFDRNDSLNNLPPLALWELRAKAADPSNILSLKQIGRIILHLSSKRGYKHARQSSDADSKNTDYVAAINNRYADLKSKGLTLGQYMYEQLRASETKNLDSGSSIVTFRIKEGDDDPSNLLPRQAHEEELMQILRAQYPHHPNVLTNKIIDEIFNIIFYQRPLKSCKHLVSRDEMFNFVFKNSAGKSLNCNPRVAPRTSPLAQLTRLWETANNIRLVNHRNQALTAANVSIEGKSTDFRKAQVSFIPTLEEKRRIVAELNTKKKFTATDLLKTLNLKKADGFKSETNIAGGIKGNETYIALHDALEGIENRDELLRFNLKIIEEINETTGEITKKVAPSFTSEPLYRLWHCIYSIPDNESLRAALINQFGITDETAIDRLLNLDFTTPGFSNRSSKFMCRILPYLMEGDMYSEACEKAGFRHSDYLTSAENEARTLLTSLSPIEKGALRQPLIEKVLNQMINLVNQILETYGPIDEIRVELARELKQTKDQRIKATKAISDNEALNPRNAVKIRELGLPVNRRTLQKYRMWEETGRKCIYCSSPISAAAFLSGDLAEVEHIIPRSLFFDDSFSNKTCSCAKCNHDKGQMTAFDFMQSRGSQQLLDFQNRVQELLDKKIISKTKFDRFMTPLSQIPTDFLERDLQQTRYISRKATEILSDVARNVYASSGKVTDFFRNAWGYNRLLETLNIERYDRAGQVERNGSRTYIKEWTKRLDHRHHAVDALTVALTRQGYIQRLSTLQASRDEMRKDIGQDYNHAYSLLEQWAQRRPHFAPDVVMKKLDEVGVSFKAGKKATTLGTIAKGARSLVPRGPLHEETIYGKIYLPDAPQPIAKCLKNPDIIADEILRNRVIELLDSHSGDVKAVTKFLKTHPLTDIAGHPLEKLATRRAEFVKREKVSALKAKQIDKIVDKAVREAVQRRYDECGSEKAFQQSFADRPLYLTPDSPFPIKRVTRETGLKESSMVVVRRHNGRPIGYAKTGSNHHIAFYELPDGKIQESVVSFWTAVHRRKLGLPAVITNPEEAWQMVEQMPDAPHLEEVAASLPPLGSKLLFTLASNEMVLLGLSDDQWRDAIASNDLATLAKHLYRVQKLTAGDYYFRFHTHTLTTEDDTAKQSENCVRLSSLGSLINQNPKKVRVDSLGNIIPVG